jgi:hypothetical protein
MRGRRVALTVGCVMTTAMIFSGSASAGTVVGSNCGGTTSIGNGIVISLKSPAGSAIPSNGVITSWTYSLGLPIPPEYSVSAQLKVFAPTAVASQFKVVGESALSQVGSGATTNLTRIPVEAGDLLGSGVLVIHEGKTEQGAIFCETKNPGDEIGEIPGDPVTGVTASTATTEAGLQNPVTVNVEPDADHDGYGDETQDKCPTDASTQGPCPTPPPPAVPITLSASAAAQKGLVTVTLTSSAQATVSVGGTVKLAKGKTAKLSGGTQIVAPGSLAKFTIVFPAKLKTALKKTPPNKKLTLSLSASAPGATTKSLMVKVPGQEKPAPRHHRR